MTLSDSSFLAVSGSVTGRDHRRAERDGQDGHAVVSTDDVVAAIVTDGCSSGRASEIGARVGAAWLAALIEQAFRGIDEATAARAAAAVVTRTLLDRLEVLARSFDPAGHVSAARVDAALLFGFLAAVVTPATTIVFGIGDGIVVVDGAITAIDPGPENAPPYLAYALFERAGGGARACLEPRIHFAGATADVEAIGVATDGAAPLVDAGSVALATIVADPRCAKNPSLLRKRLIVLSDAGTFVDDATIAIVRRTESARSA
jgi:hypothetical protein